MNPVLKATQPTIKPTARLFPELAAPLAQVDELLRQELRSDVPAIDELLSYIAALSGKRLRPALLLLAAQATGDIRDEHIVLSAVIEMIHIATLVHDDILDEAATRRHQATVNKRWGNQSSVLLGDYLFTHSFYLASTLDTTYACRRIGQATNRVCAGELRQVAHRGNLRLSEAEYYEIIKGKTAELCACASQLGAHFAGASPDVALALESYGMQLGMAFQIADDLLDVVGDESSTGKSLGTDMEKQKLTLPIIHLLDSSNGGDQQELMQMLTAANNSQVVRQRLGQLLEQYGSIDYVQSVAMAAAQQAADYLTCLPPSAARETLVGLTEFVVARSH